MTFTKKPNEPKIDFWLERHYRRNAETEVTKYAQFLAGAEAQITEVLNVLEAIDSMMALLAAARENQTVPTANMPRTSCGTPNNLLTHSDPHTITS